MPTYYRVHASLLLCLLLHHDSGYSSLITNCVASWHATVLSEYAVILTVRLLVNRKNHASFLNILAPLFAGIVGDQK